MDSREIYRVYNRNRVLGMGKLYQTRWQTCLDIWSQNVVPSHLARIMATTGGRRHGSEPQANR